MITELTQDQIDKIPHYVEKWVKIITSTDQTDRPKAEKAVKEICKILKLNTPEIIWFDSPKEAGDKIETMDYDLSFYYRLGHAILTECFHGKIHDDIRMQIKVLMWKTKVGFSKMVEDIESIFIDEGYPDYCDPIPHMYWELCYDYCINCLGIEDTPGLLKPFKQVYESCFSIDFYDNTCVLCEQPTVFSINDKGQLHNDEGPALAFNDGFEIHAINGKRQTTG